MSNVEHARQRRGDDATPRERCARNTTGCHQLNSRKHTRSLARNCDARRRLLASVGYLNHRDSGEHERGGVDRAHANRFADERPSQHKRNERIHIGIGRHARGVEDTNIWQAQDFFATEIGIVMPRPCCLTSSCALGMSCS